MIQLMLVHFLGKPWNGSLISMRFSKTSEKSVLPLQTTIFDKKVYSTNMLSWFRTSGISAITRPSTV